MDWNSLFTMVAIGLMFFFMMRHGGGCCGGTHTHGGHRDAERAGKRRSPASGGEPDEPK